MSKGRWEEQAKENSQGGEERMTIAPTHSSEAEAKEV